MRGVTLRTQSTRRAEALAQAQEQILINRPVEQVWGFHSDPTNIPRISVNTTRYEPKGPMALGCRIIGATKVIGKTVEWEADVVEYAPQRGYRLRSVVAPLQWELAYSYRPIQGKTMVIAEQTAFGLSGFFGRISEKFIVMRYRRDLAKNLANLKQMVEDLPAPGGQ